MDHDRAPALVLDAKVDVGVGRNAQLLRFAAQIAVTDDDLDFRRALLLIRGLGQGRSRQGDK